MAKWYGTIGYVTAVQTKPSVWKNQTIERKYSGDVMRTSSSWNSNSDSTIDDLRFDGQISIVADPFANQHFSSMRWIELYGAKWKIIKVEPRHPRLILTVGGVYNG